MGEALGENEAREGRPFVEYAQAGGLLERAFKLGGYDRKQFRLANAIQCRPPRDWLTDAPWELDALNHCETHRMRIINEMKPRAILALGNTPLRVLTGAAGKNRGISYLRGYVLPMLDTDIPVIGGFHPAFIRRGKANLMNTLLHDIKKAVQIAQGQASYCLHPEIDAGKHVQYITRPTLDDFRSYMFRAAENQGAVMFFDLETSNSMSIEEDADDEVQLEVDAGAISQIQFSLGPKEAIAAPWEGEFKEMAIQMLGMPHVKAGHNAWRFDLPVLARDNVKVAGVVHDTRWMWHHLQPDLPAHLQFVCSFYGMPFPWKHMADANEEFYGCADADGGSRIMAALPKQLQSKGVWVGYERQVIGLEPVLVSMSKRGIPVNDEKRQALGVRIAEAREQKRTESQTLWPEALRKYHPAAGYKKPPQDKTGLVLRDFPDLAPEGQLEIVECVVQRWCRPLPFNPGSWQQVIEYMKWRKHPVPKSAKTGKQTTEESEMLKLAKKTKDPMYKLILDYRELDKMYGTYVEGWTPGKDGCVHPSFNCGTAVGQLASKNPNGQNFPRRSELATDMRRMIEAQTGKVLIEVDMSSFHAVTLAFEASSPNWMRLARSDIHSFTTAHFLKLDGREHLLELPDDELIDRLKWIKKHHRDTRDNKAKHAILGVGNGLGYRKMYRTYWEYFTNEKECKTLLDTIKGIFPEVFQYQNRRRQEAHAHSYLISRWKFIRWFFDVLHWDAKQQQMVPGDDSEAAIAFHHVNDAFGLMRENMLWLRSTGLDEKFGLCNSIHDSFVFHCDKKYADECIETTYDRVTRRCKVLVDKATAPDGLYVDAEAKIGQNWVDMDKVTGVTPAGLKPGPDGEMPLVKPVWDVEYFVPEHPPIKLPYRKEESWGRFDFGNADDVPF